LDVLQSVTIGAAVKTSVQQNYNFQTLSKVRIAGNDGGSLPPGPEEGGVVPVPTTMEFSLGSVLDRAGLPVNAAEIQHIALAVPNSKKGDLPRIIAQAAMRDMKLVRHLPYACRSLYAWFTLPA
jgi:hypothetical protein